mmetsp:Transcript_42215/g.123609  ORF Transcript_42215/g.123609 Transcript_42215/m.123609 type:complete len:310 (+) Transcript_42215:3-932(+)
MPTSRGGGGSPPPKPPPHPSPPLARTPRVRESTHARRTRARSDLQDAEAALLVAIVGARPPVVERLGDERIGEARVRVLAHRRLEALRHRFDGRLARTEARQRAAHTDVRGAHGSQQLVLVSSRLEEASHHERAEVGEPGRAGPSHHLDPLRGELEGGGLEAHVLARRVGEEEAKVDVDEGAVGVQQDVAVVPVLDLQQVAYDRVGRERLHKVAPRAVEGRGVRAAVAPLEELGEGVAVGRHRLLKRIERLGVWHHLDEARGGRRGEDAVGAQPQRQLRMAEDALEVEDELHGKLLLQQLVVRLHNHRH